MNICLIIGEPATGKTTLMRALLSNFETIPARYGSAVFHEGKQVLIVGDYRQGTLFDGTDKLSMSVINDVERLLSDPKWDSYTVFAEGDRLANKRFIDFAFNRAQLFLYCLICAEKILARRRESRIQNESWVKGRSTKIKNLCDRYRFFKMEHNNEQHTQDIVRILRSHV